jgi:hypothetical protein
MSTYLRNLVARTIGAATVVRPYGEPRLHGGRGAPEEPVDVGSTSALLANGDRKLNSGEAKVSAAASAARKRGAPALGEPATEVVDGAVRPSHADMPIASPAGSIRPSGLAEREGSTMEQQSLAALPEHASRNVDVNSENFPTRTSRVVRVDAAANEDFATRSSRIARVDAAADEDFSTRTPRVTRVDAAAGEDFSMPTSRVARVDAASDADGDELVVRQQRAVEQTESDSPRTIRRFEERLASSRGPHADEIERASRSASMNPGTAAILEDKVLLVKARTSAAAVAEPQDGPEPTDRFVSRRRVHAGSVHKADQESSESESGSARDETVINVTIGRIEVRAPAAAPRAKTSLDDQRKAASPRSQLEEYLSSRNQPRQ